MNPIRPMKWRDDSFPEDPEHFRWIASYDHLPPDTRNTAPYIRIGLMQPTPTSYEVEMRVVHHDAPYSIAVHLSSDVAAHEITTLDEAQAWAVKALDWAIHRFASIRAALATEPEEAKDTK